MILTDVTFNDSKDGSEQIQWNTRPSQLWGLEGVVVLLLTWQRTLTTVLHAWVHSADQKEPRHLFITTVGSVRRQLTQAKLSRYGINLLLSWHPVNTNNVLLLLTVKESTQSGGYFFRQTKPPGSRPWDCVEVLASALKHKYSLLSSSRSTVLCWQM